MNDLVSVIIPVYNVEAYLCQCLNSVLNSTHSNLQVILVDDGSTDSCSSVCDTYADRDNRITVIHQENQGLPAARNAGVAVARGEFVAFVDSDDMISPTMIETLLWAMEHTNADIAACEYTRDPETQACLPAPALESLKIINGMGGCVQVFSGEPSIRAITWTGPMVWNKLYRKQKIKTTFKKGCVPAEDMQFNWEYAENCSSMVIVPQALYYWRINSNSITQTPNASKYVTIARVWMDIAQKTHGVNASLQAHLHYRAASSAHIALWWIIQSGLETQYLEFCNQSLSIIKQYFQEVLTHKDADFYMKIVYLLCRYCYPVWKLLPKAYEHLKRVYKK